MLIKKLYSSSLDNGKSSIVWKKRKMEKTKETKLNFCSAGLSCPSALRPASRGGAVTPQSTNFSQVLPELDWVLLLFPRCFFIFWNDTEHSLFWALGAFGFFVLFIKDHWSSPGKHVTWVIDDLMLYHTLIGQTPQNQETTCKWRDFFKINLFWDKVP